jgi:hypothetical protein
VVPDDPDGQGVLGGPGGRDEDPDAAPGEETYWDDPGGTCDPDAVVGGVDAGDGAAVCGTWAAMWKSGAGAAAWEVSAAASGVDADDAGDAAAASVATAVEDAEDAGGAAAACSAARGPSWEAPAWCVHSEANAVARCAVPDASGGGRDVVVVVDGAEQEGAVAVVVTAVVAVGPVAAERHPMHVVLHQRESMKWT